MRSSVPFDKPKRNDMMVASVVPSQRPVAAPDPATEVGDVIAVPDESLTPEAIIAQSDAEHGEAVAAAEPLPTVTGTSGGRLQPEQHVQVASAGPQPSLRRTMLEAKGDPAAMLDSGVMTTAKKAKPHRQVVQGQSPKVIQAASEIPDRALSSEQVAETAPAVVPAVLRNSSMRKAPTTVYTAGFPAGAAGGECQQIHRQGRHIHADRQVQPHQRHVTNQSRYRRLRQEPPVLFFNDRFCCCSRPCASLSPVADRRYRCGGQNQSSLLRQAQ